MRALLAHVPAAKLQVTVFSSSWRDRLEPLPELGGASLVDRRIPVRLLNLAWHRLGWPPAERLAGHAFDVTHSMHPLIVPARRAAHVVTIHDLDFLAHPERTRAEVRRDYPALAGRHARRADRVIVPSRFTAREVEQQLGVPPHMISVCPHGAPEGWTARSSPPADGYVLFVGTLEPRKNVGALLDAYERLAGRRRMPRLILAGRAVAASRRWLERLERPPLRGLAEHVGYVADAKRRELYEGARVLVQPSFEEGFGLTVLEAMTVGVPVVAADRGSLPEVLGDAGLLVDPSDPDAIAAAIERLLDDEALAASAAARGVMESRRFTWAHAAQQVYEAYERALAHRSCASA